MSGPWFLAPWSTRSTLSSFSLIWALFALHKYLILCIPTINVLLATAMRFVRWFYTNLASSYFFKTIWVSHVSYQFLSNYISVILTLSLFANSYKISILLSFEPAFVGFLHFRIVNFAERYFLKNLFTNKIIYKGEKGTCYCHYTMPKFSSVPLTDQGY